MAIIKAPFNFVPVSENVFFPDWASKISQDVPFEDGESGCIELKITAETPLFVRNGHTKQDHKEKNDRYKSFSTLDDRYFIPATSLKGSIRNVLEIISFSKMSLVSNDRYSLRDLHLKDDYLKYFQNNEIHCGWMTKHNDTVTITDHGIPKRISHEDLDHLWGTDFVDTFTNARLLKDDAHRTALFKMNKAAGKKKEINYVEFPMNSVNPEDKRIIANISSDPDCHGGTIVLTGQPSARENRIKNMEGEVTQKGKGKCFEFVFPNEVVEGDPHNLIIDEEDGLYKDFCFIYKDSVDWKYWCHEMEKGNRVPVFFSLAGGQLVHFGLSYLYKLPYKRRIKDCLPPKHLSESLDLSECLFGNTRKNDALKGRIQFSHAFMSEGSLMIDDKLAPYMASPKSSYYPIYLEQRGSNGFVDGDYVTMMSDEARLKGWKRYPVHSTISDFQVSEEISSDNLSPFYPVNIGSVFTCKIRFHNLKKVEIGALIKAIEFDKQGSHSIGFAKSYGYGKVKIDVFAVEGLNFTKDDYVNSFIELMSVEISGYTKSRELNELKLMCYPQKLRSPLEYMKLKEFADCKRVEKNKCTREIEKYAEYLPYYSGLIKKDTSIQKERRAAVVTLVARKIVNAKLIEGADQTPKALIVPLGKYPPKEGTEIIVNVTKKGGTIVSLEFVKKKDS